MAFEVLYLQTGETPARLDRWWIDRIFTEGVSDVPAGELLVTQRVGAANLSVDVAAGSGIVDGDDVADQGAYLVRSTTVVNLPLSAPPAAGTSRIDLVVFKVHDSTSTGEPASEDGAALEVVEGVAAAAPVAPAVPDTALVLAQVLVAAGDAAITDNEVTDRRVQMHVEPGTAAQPLTTAERNALPAVAKFPGALVFNLDTGRLERYDGATWVPDVTVEDLPESSTTGTYVGDSASTRTIPLPFTPKLVYLINNQYDAYIAGPIGSSQGRYFTGNTTSQQDTSAVYFAPQIVTNGFRVGVYSNPSGDNTNYSGNTYRYVAFA